MGLALASAPSITVSLTATGLQKMMSVMATLNLPSRRGQYKVETNQCTEELASIRAQPRVKDHFAHIVLIYCLLWIACQLGIFHFLSHLGISEAALPAIAAALRRPTAGHEEQRDRVQWDPTRENIVSSLCAEKESVILFLQWQLRDNSCTFAIPHKPGLSALLNVFFLKWRFEQIVFKCQSWTHCVI